MAEKGCRSPDLTRTQREEILRDGRITPALVQAVADKVYAMLLRDTALERERHRLWACRARGEGG